MDAQRSPATFRVGAGGTIKASMGLVGMRQVDLVVDSHTTTLTPVDGTAEAWRLRLERERPGLSRLTGAASWIVLAVALVFEVSQLIGLVGGALGADFDSPIRLSGPANLVLGLAALAAALERALRFKSGRWLG